MQKIWKKILISILTLITITSNIVIPNVNANGNDPEKFSGMRRIIYVADSSDLDNFINGGRTTFDFLLRKNAPEWLTYNLGAKDREVYLSIGFEFTSYEDYEAKLSELLTHSPNVVKQDSDELFLLEGDSALSFMNFLQSILGSLSDFNGGAIEKIFKVTENVIELDKKEYKEQGERLTIRPSGEKVIKFDSIEISTYCIEKNVFYRSIKVENDDENDAEKLQERFGNVGEVELEEVTNGVQMCVLFEAFNLTELTQKTMECLNVTSSISEHQEYIDDETVGVTCSEFIDLSELLNEEGICSYVFDCPEYYCNISSEDENVSTENQRITARNLTSISYYYERGFKFNSIEVSTDMSGLSGKRTRKITFKAPTEIAAYYHEIIKEWSQKQIPKGTTLDIYDENGNRYYQFSFSSWFWDDIEEFTQEILNGTCAIETNETWIPFGKNGVQEKLKVGSLISDKIPINEISVSYTLGKISKVVLRDTKENVVVSGKTVLFQIGNGDKINFSYNEISLMKSILELLVIVVVATLNLKLKKIKRKTKKARFCSNCGNTINSEQEFCGVCGTEL